MVEELGSGILGKAWLAKKYGAETEEQEDLPGNEFVIKQIDKSFMEKNEMPDKMLK